jgi:hypothetical protein
MKIDFDQATHIYKIDGFPVPSVTQIIRETVGIGWGAAEWYLTRGRAIHACAAFIAQGKEFKFDDRLTGYVAALKKFFAEVKPIDCMSEMPVGCSFYRYCGTVDLVCTIGSYRAIIDYKHSFDKYRIALQLGGYSVAIKEASGFDIKIGFGVQIKENGTYQMTDKIDLRTPRNEFLALRTTYAVKERLGELSSQKEKKENE